MRVGCKPMLAAGAVALLAAILTAPAATSVSGSISSNVVWEPAGNPYIVGAALTVSAPGVLTIQPGVEVQIAPGVLFNVAGTLLAAGTDTSPIRFTRTTGAPYGGSLYFTGTSYTGLATGILEYCEFSFLRYASISVSAVLESRYADLDVAQCSFGFLLSTSVRLSDSRVSFVDNLIDNTGEVINLIRCAGLVASNHISQVVGYADGIDIDYYWEGPGDATIVIEHNLLDGGPDPDADGIDFGTASNVVFRHNIVRNFGDKGISIGERSSVVGYNNLISGCNIGIAIKDSSTPQLANCTIVSCNFGVRAYQKYAGYGGGRGSLTNSIIWNCTTPISLENASSTTFGYCDIQGVTPWPGTANITNNPQFVDASNANYRLSWDSPGLNAGTNQTWMTGAHDLEGHPRISGLRVDLGAYERPAPAAFVWPTIASTQVVDVPIPVTLVAVDENTNVVSDFAGLVSLELRHADTDALLLSNPASPVRFTNGSWSGELTPRAAATSARFRAIWKDVRSNSAPFAILALPVVRIHLPESVSEGDGILVAAGQLALAFVPDAGFDVTLTSTGATELQITNTVTVPAGVTNIAFDLTIADDDGLDGTAVATVSGAAAGCAVIPASLQILDDDQAVLTIAAPASVPEGSGLLTNAATVTASTAPAIDFVVTLAADHPALQLPPNVVLPAGQTSAVFNLTIPDDGAFNGTRPVVLSAHVPGWLDGTRVVMVTDNEFTNLSLSLPAQTVEGLGLLPHAGRVAIAATLATDLPVTIAAADTNSLLVPPLVTIAAGQTHVDFDLVAPDNPAATGVHAVAVLAQAAGFEPATEYVTIFDNPVHHFAFTPVASPQTSGAPFAVTLRAYDTTNGLLTQFPGPVSLHAANTGGDALPMSPQTSGLFSNGLWSGMLSIDVATAAARFTATDAAGHSGTSAVFSVVNAPPSEFTWAPIHSPQVSNTPFAVAITARLLSGAVDQNYTGTAALGAWHNTDDGTAAIRITEVNHMVPDAIEFMNVSDQSVDISGWTITLYDAVSWPAPLTTTTVPAGTSVRPRQIFSLVENGSPPGSLPTFYTGGNVGWTSSTRAAVLLRDASGQIVDFVCAAGATPASISLPSAISTNHWSGAPIPGAGANTDYQRRGNRDTNTSNDWRQASSGIAQTNLDLTLPFEGVAIPMPLTPTNTDAFVSGEWTGLIQVLQTGTDVYLRVAAPGVPGVFKSAAFDVVTQAVPDADGDGIPDDWEQTHFGTLARNGTGDFDLDGMSDAGEYEAGTSPTNAADVLRATAVWLMPGSLQPAFQWPTVSGRFYAVLGITNLRESADWTTNPSFAETMSSGAPMAFSNDAALPPAQFYRIGVRRGTN